MDWKDWCRLCGNVVQEETLIKPSGETLQIFESSEFFFQFVVSVKNFLLIKHLFNFNNFFKDP